jgi:hypothetical protein
MIISPNLGRPFFLNIDPKLKKETFQTEILLISNISDPVDFEKQVKGEIKLTPVLDYMWKFRNIYKLSWKRKGELEDEEHKGFWARRKERRMRKKKTKIIDEEFKDEEKLLDFKMDDIDYKIKKLRVRPYRGKPLSVSIRDIKEVPIIPISNLSYLDTLSPQDYLLKYKIYGNLSRFYRVFIEFKVSKEVKKFLKSRNFIMFDLSFADAKINFHSIVISKQDWKNFKFVHATDLHLAERNDKIYDVIKNWTESSIKKNVDDFLETAAKKLKIKRKIKHKEDSLDDIKIPLRKRLINPNNQFRKFIKLANRKIFNNELDFIVLTGDLVDYTVLSRFTKKVRELNEFKYEESNWQVFKNITLNSNINKGIKGVIKGEELLCPIFTTIGNVYENRLKCG